MEVVKAVPGEAVLLLLMQEFYREEALVFSSAAEHAAMELLVHPQWGEVHILRDGPRAIGYFVLTFGYSLERGGRFALLDELYVAPGARGRGVGKAALQEAIAIAVRAGCHALHLEVEHTNVVAQELYKRAGFHVLPRHYLARRLDAEPDQQERPRT